jgi:hypothetical protein
VASTDTSIDTEQVTSTEPAIDDDTEQKPIDPGEPLDDETEVVDTEEAAAESTTADDPKAPTAASEAVSKRTAVDGHGDASSSTDSKSSADDSSGGDDAP